MDGIIVGGPERVGTAGRRLTLEVTIPANTTATLRVPAGWTGKDLPAEFMPGKHRLEFTQSQTSGR